MEFSFPVSQLLYSWLLPGSGDTALLNGNTLSQRVLMNQQLQQVIDSMGIYSAKVTKLNHYNIIGLKFANSNHKPREALCKRA
jgi:hypothetical protein